VATSGTATALDYDDTLLRSEVPGILVVGIGLLNIILQLPSPMRCWSRISAARKK
jgi:hypothetical protein